MTIRLDHTIVPAKDKVAAAEFFAEIFGLRVKPGRGYFAQVQINESLTFDFADDEPGESHHYAFHVSEAEFDGIWSRVKARHLPYGSAPDDYENGRLYRRRGGRGFYFADPNGHLLEVMTVPETGA
jgi:catechol 2,3-dioxygenase-like lactoylglutathione lyase family enzyme